MMLIWWNVSVFGRLGNAHAPDRDRHGRNQDRVAECEQRAVSQRAGAGMGDDQDTDKPYDQR
jgi:hypothetical protein